MISETKQELIEKYLAKTLTLKEEKQFEQLKSTSPDFDAEVDFFKNLFTSVEVFGDNEFAKELKALDEQMELSLQKEKNTTHFSAKALWEDFLHQMDYTVEQLTSFFVPNPNYALLLENAHRGERFKVLAPPNNFACLGSRLNFELQKPHNQSLTLSIEDNQQDLVHRIVIPADESLNFAVDLSELDINKPGLYYWKLTDGKETCIRIFYVRKDLMPQG